MWVRHARVAMALSLLVVPTVASAQAVRNVFRAGFSEMSGGRSTAVVIADVDGDGAVDVVVTNPDTSLGGAVAVLNGFNDGEVFLDFNSIQVGSSPSSLVMGDFDEDEVPDLVVANQGDNSVVFLKGLLSLSYFDPPAFPIAVGESPLGVAAGKIDGDDHLDIVVANQGVANTAGSVSVLRGDGLGNFTVVQQPDPTPEDPNQTAPDLTTDLDTRAVALGDVDGDEVPDIVALNTSSSTNRQRGSLTIFHGNGDGTFEAGTFLEIGGAPEGMALVDLNRDDKLDVVTADTTDNAVSVLLGNDDGTFAERKSFTVGDFPVAVAVADMDGDARLDVVSANQRSSDMSILLGDGRGQLGRARSFVADPEVLGVALGDMDDNDTTDVVAITAADAGSVAVLRNLGDGTLNATEDVLVGTSPSGVVAADIDDDGLSDMVAAADAGSVLIFRALATGGFAAPETLTVGGRPAAIVAQDLNGDARVDLAVADNSTPGRIAVTYGLGRGHFGPVMSLTTEAQAVALTSGDFDGNGRMDLAAAAGGAEGVVSVLLRQANGTYAAAQNTPVDSTPVSIVAADSDGDGRDDLVVANQASSTVTILKSSGNGSFTNPQTLNSDMVNEQPTSLTVADFDRNGLPDFAVAGFGSSNDSVKLFLSNGNGTFRAGGSATGGLQIRALAARDFTGDQRVDLAIVNQTANQVGLLARSNSCVISRAPCITDADCSGVGDTCSEQFVSRPAPGTTGYKVSRMPVSVAVGDFNGDGRYDAATANNAPSANNLSVLDNCVRLERCGNDQTFPGAEALRGDANGDEQRSAADLVATAKEIADGDGRLIEAIGRGTFVASTGVDANGDGRVDAQDRTAVARRIFRGA